MGSFAVALALLVIAVDIGLARLGYGLLLPAIRSELGGDYAVYGAIGASHLGGYLAGTIVAPLVLRNRAHSPRVTAAAHLVVAGALAASAAASGLLVLGAARVVLGIASGIGIASAVTDALERVPAQRRGGASALAWSGIGIGLIISAPGGVWALDHIGAWRTAMLLAALFALAIAVAALGLPAQRISSAATGTASAFTWRTLLAADNVWFVAAYGSYGVAYIAYATFAVAAFARRGLSPMDIGGVWAIFGAAATLGAFAVGRVLTGAAHRWALALPLAIAAAGALVSALPPVAAVVGGALSIGLGLAAAPAVASAFARDRSDAASYARAFAGVTTVFGIGQIVGPILAGAAADTLGLNAVPLLAATVFGIGAWSAAVDARRHAPVAVLPAEAS